MRCNATFLYRRYADPLYGSIVWTPQMWSMDKTANSIGRMSIVKMPSHLSLRGSIAIGLSLG